MANIQKELGLMIRIGLTFIGGGSILFGTLAFLWRDYVFNGSTNLIMYFLTPLFFLCGVFLIVIAIGSGGLNGKHTKRIN